LNAAVIWKGQNGILIRGRKYLVIKVRQGKRVKEFMLAACDGHHVHPATWWEAGAPFRFIKTEVENG